MSQETFAPWDTAEILKNDKMIVEYLQAALEENEPAFFVKAIANAARAKGMTQVGKDGRAASQKICRALSGKRDLRLSTLMKVLDSLGVQLTVAPSRIEDVEGADLAPEPALARA